MYEWMLNHELDQLEALLDIQISYGMEDNYDEWN